MGLSDARFQMLDVAALPSEPEIDLIHAIHDQVDLAQVLLNL